MHYTPAGFIDSEDKNGNFIPGEWRSQNKNTVRCGSYQSINAVQGSQSRVDALEVRNRLKNYLNSNEVSHSKLIMFAEHLIMQCDKNLI